MKTNKLSREESLRIIASKGTVSVPGVYRAKVTNVTPYSRALNNGVQQVAIANFNLKSDYHEKNAMELFAQGQYDAAANNAFSLPILEGQQIPLKGQYVDLVIDEVTTSKGITGLFAQSCTAAPVIQPRKVSMAELERAYLDAKQEQEVIVDEIPFEHD